MKMLRSFHLCRTARNLRNVAIMTKASNHFPENSTDLVTDNFGKASPSATSTQTLAAEIMQTNYNFLHPTRLSEFNTSGMQTLPTIDEIPPEEEPPQKMITKFRAGLRSKLSKVKRVLTPDKDKKKERVSAKQMRCVVRLMDDTMLRFRVNDRSTIADLKSLVAESCGLTTTRTFHLFGDSAESEMFSDDRLVVSVEPAKDGCRKFVMKKLTFCPEEIELYQTDEVFLECTFAQARMEYLDGGAGIKDQRTFAKLTALVLKAEDENENFYDQSNLEAVVAICIPPQVVPTSEFTSRVRLEGTSKLFPKTSQEAMVQFLKIMDNCPYSNCKLWEVELIQSYWGDEGSSVKLGINRHGLHFFDSESSEIVKSIKLSSIIDYKTSKESFIRVTLESFLSSVRQELEFDPGDYFKEVSRTLLEFGKETSH